MMTSTARRAFLRGAGLGAFALPFVRAAHGIAAPPPRYLVVFFTMNGTIMNEFFPNADGSYRRILKPIEALRQKLIVMRGIDMKSAMKPPVPANHGPDTVNALIARQSPGSGYQPAGISVDQYIANALAQQTRIPFPSLQLGVVGAGGGGNQAISARGPSQTLPPENNPYKAFDQVFKGAAASPADYDRIKAERKSVADHVLAELQDLRCALGAEERPKFDLHVQSIRDLERSLDVTVSASCQPDLGAPVTASDTRMTATVLDKQIDVTVNALRCDLTRVVLLAVSRGASGLAYDFPAGPGVPGSHHGNSHGSEGQENTSPAERLERLILTETWHAQMYGKLLARLDATPQVTGGGTLLDNSAVLWAHEQSNGATHQRNDMPYVLGGSCGGVFKTGRAVNFGGKAHNGLLISLANAMGVPTETFGDPEFSNGPLAGL